MYSTPIINTNDKVQKTINDLTAQLKTHFEEKRIQQARINELQRKLDLLAVHNK
jgi:hypothetical protein